MPRKTTFQFDEEQQVRLVECLHSAYTTRSENPNCKSNLKDITALNFKKFYPDCRLQTKSLYLKALEFDKKLKTDTTRGYVDLSFRGNESISDVTTGNDTSISESETKSVSDVIGETVIIDDGRDSAVNNVETSASIGVECSNNNKLNCSDSIFGEFKTPIITDEAQIKLAADTTKDNNTESMKDNDEVVYGYKQEDFFFDDSSNDSLFNEVVTPASETGDENEFAWDKNKEQKLLECLKKARSNKNSSKRIEIRLHDEFIKLYPAYTCKPTTLIINARALESGKKTSLKSAKTNIPHWYQEKEMYLIKCAVEAHKENQNNLATGMYAGKTGIPSNFTKIMVDKFRDIHPGEKPEGVIKKFRELKQKFKLEFEVATPDLSEHDFRRIMSYWQHGYTIAVRALFEGCCYTCSALLVYRGRKNSIATRTDPEHVPVLDHYPDEYLEEMFKKSERVYYKCNICKRNNLLEQYPLAPAGERILPIPEQLQNLNSAEKKQIGLVGLFSTTEKVRDSRFGVFEHRRGETFAWHKADMRYFEMYSMIIHRSAVQRRQNPEKIVAALKKLREINPLYQSFYAHYETLYRYYDRRDPNAPQAISIFDKKVVEPLCSDLDKDLLLEEEPAALLIPQSDLEARGTAPMSQTVAGAQHTRDFQRAKQTTRNLLWVTYTDPKLAEKIFPWLHPHGTGGWSSGRALPMGMYYRWRISMADDRFRNEPDYCFYFLDVLIKTRIQYRNSVKVQVDDLQRPLTKEDFDVQNVYTSKYGLEVPSTIPNSRNYWYVKLNELLALAAKMNRVPDVFITLTQNDSWPEMQAVIRNGMRAKAEIYAKENIPLKFDCKETVNRPFEMAQAFYRRLQAFKERVLRDKNGLCGEVEDYWYRIEYQQRGGLHVHLAAWCKAGTVPANVITAEMPRFDHPHNEKWRAYVKKLEIHECRPRCFSVGKGKTTRNCKYGFPFVLCDKEQIDETGIRHLYKRTHAEDMHVVPHNLALMLFWGAHVNIQRVTANGWEMYLAKYVAKSATPVKVTVEEPKKKAVPKKSGKGEEHMTDVERYLTTRLVSSLECCAILLQKHHAASSRDMIYLPVDVDPPSRFVRRKEHMDDDDPQNIYYQSKLEKYMDRPDELAELTYPRFYAEYYYGGGKKPQRRFPADNLFDDENEDELECPDNDDDNENGPLPRQHLVDKQGRYLTRRTGKEAVPYFRHFSPYGDQLEQYCLRKLLENVPVNRETVRLLKSRTGTYMQECLERNLIEQEDEAMHYLEACVKRGFSIERLTTTAHKLIEGNWLRDQDVKKLLETVAPYHLDIEEALAKQLVDDNDETAAPLLNVRPKLPLHDYVDKFSTMQRLAYKYITSRWAEGKAVRAFVSGEAGCGKSFLMEAIAAYCKENEMTVQKLGTTGCAAYLVGGLTIHCFFKLDVNLKCYLEMGTNEAYFVKKVDVIMIDEVSMLEEALLDKIDELLRNVTEQPLLPFGGKSIIMFGDVAQLPAITSNIWRHNAYARYFDTLVLRENMRASDPEFQRLLNNARVCKLTPADWELLESRLIFGDRLLDIDNGAYLVAHRKTKAAYDQMRLDELEGEVYEYVAEDVDLHDHPVSERMAQFIATIERVSHLLPKVLRIKVGAKVMLLRNKNFRHGWVNGRIATVLCVTADYIVLQAVDSNFRIVVERTKQEITWPYCAGKTYYRKQFPLELAYAITIHKSQGQTLDKVVVNAKSLFATGQFYTAISRARNLGSLHFTVLQKSSVIFAPELANLLKWFDKVDVLRGFTGEKPPMPYVPRNWDMSRETKSGKKKVVRMQELIDGLFSSSEEDDDEGGVKKILNPPSPGSAVVIKKKKQKKSSTQGKRADVFKAPPPPPPVDDDKTAMSRMFRDVRDIPLTLDREAYTAAFRAATRNVDVPSFRNSMRSASSVVTFRSTMKTHGPAQQQLYKTMADHCTVVFTHGGGHCMFNMAAISLFGDDRRHFQVRAAVLLTFIENWQHFEDNAIIYGFETLQELIRDTCRFTEQSQIGWGSNAHLKALAIASGRDVYVYLPLSPNDRQNYMNVPTNRIQEAIDEGTTQHMRYSPLEPIEGRTPIMTILSGLHYSAILKNRVHTAMFVPRGRGDVPLQNLEQHDVNQVPIVLSDDGDESRTKDAVTNTIADELAEQFKTKTAIVHEKRPTSPGTAPDGGSRKTAKKRKTSTDSLGKRFESLSTDSDRSPATSPPPTRRKIDNNDDDKSPSRGGKRRRGSSETSPVIGRASGKVNEGVTTRKKRRTSTESVDSNASLVSSSVRSSHRLPHKIDEKTIKQLLESIKKISARTSLRTYAERVLKLTEAAEIDTFLRAARDAEPATHARSMIVHTAAQKLLYRALTKHVTVVRTGGTDTGVFNACSIDLFGNEKQHLQLRAAVCHVLAQNFICFERYRLMFGKYESVQKLIYNTCCVDNTANTVAWASCAHLKAMATVARREIYVYLPLVKTDRTKANVDEQDLQSAIDHGRTQHKSYRPVEAVNSIRAPLMMFLTANHFSAVVPLPTADSTFVVKPQLFC